MHNRTNDRGACLARRSVAFTRADVTQAGPSLQRGRESIQGVHDPKDEADRLADAVINYVDCFRALFFESHCTMVSTCPRAMLPSFELTE